ncbi:ZrgA family zinc uptake protein [Jeongeupia chitinilytica]|uniref:DUF2796 domain-containing protein n=1 Tax=Jeongeupia chitinilytica TaxID=1041641 RepID=A0ABQ3H4B7_9NEIS|nr:DUF2796 domain-containing protein [Jeongeupia chitinilytica]GHD69756.1 hypothetical protein GCM10007350_36880 [Jeongeupia chitinilytica]
MKKWIVLLALTSAAAWAHDDEHHEHGPHQHGVATLDVAFDKGELALDFASPADNVLGFEHAPKTDAERKKIDQMTKTLSLATNLFVPEAAAGCKTSPVKVAAPDWSTGAHVDIDADYSFKCQRAPASIALPLWKQYPNIRELVVNIATDKGQRQLRLKPGQTLNLR